MTATSVSLLERLRSPAGVESPEAWRRLVELYGPLIRYWLRQNAALAPDADDLVQEVLTVLVRRIGEFQHNGRR
ncbi:MAG: RNA polymerase subunit sigma-24, partial [Planctomycetota bacterium]